MMALLVVALLGAIAFALPWLLVLGVAYLLRD